MRGRARECQGAGAFALGGGRVAVVCLAIALSSGTTGAQQPQPSVAAATTSDSVDFVREIRPILSQHCFACHGPDAASREADLSLTTHADATAARAHGFRAIAPYSTDESEVWLRITDPDNPMPPHDARNPLTSAQIELVGRWIEQGATYAPHWAYRPPRRTVPQQSARDDWARSDVDRYVLARLEAEGLSPAPDADPVTLIRRVTLDLTGLPPTSSEIDAFLGDASDEAYERAVDRLLASPRYGERMASLWLDLVRFADTVGYHGDQDHRIWPYRDYVINSFNANTAFDRFTIEQLAGDLLEDPTQEQLVATGYNRLLQTSHEGGVQLKEYRAIYMADRVRNLSGVWMGATVGCAQCHDHKFDPYTTRDFYSLGAFFADVDDEEHLRDPYAGLNTLPTPRVPEMRVQSSETSRVLDAIHDRIAATERRLQSVGDSLSEAQPKWEQELLSRLDAGSTTEFVWVDDVLDTGGRTQGDWTFVREAGVPPQSGELYRRQQSNGLIQHYSADTTQKQIVVADGDVFFAWVYASPDDAPEAVMLQFNTGGQDWQHRAVWGGDQIAHGRRDKSWAGYRRMGSLPETGAWARLEVGVADVGLEPGAVISGIAFTQFGGTLYWDKAGMTSTRAAPASVELALRTPAEERTAEQTRLLRDRFLRESPEMRELRARLAELNDERDAVMRSLPLTMYTRALDVPREVRVLPRGNWLDESGEIVEPAIPAFLGRLGREGRATRLDLARWLVTPEEDGGIGGSTARVFVNRVWAMLFGQGLCSSLDDFGGQGVPPTYPDLLDYLAREFVDSGWDVKALVRRLVRTRTYLQASTPGERAFQADPENVLFARQARYRLPAEMVRDSALAVSGLLVEQVGGPSIKPPQPEGLYRHLNFPTREYERDTGPEQWRRGVYMHWQRQFPHPMLRAFDAPTREECTASRPVSNTPLAALTLLNDPTFIEASRAFAQRVLLAEHDTDRERIEFAWREATGRKATAGEVEVLDHLLSEGLEYYATHPNDAAQLVRVGDAPVDDSLAEAELAAWTQVTRAVLNLHETITRE